MRDSRPAMGTAVGITARAPRSAIDAAYAAIERYEAELSEWRPESATSRLMALGSGQFSAEALGLFRVAEEVRIASNGAFDLGWQGGRAWIDGDVVRATGKLGLGGLLKGFLCDRAADALIAAGVGDFVIDAAGDIVARGDAGDGPRGWPVTVVTEAATWNYRLRDEALSTSAEDRQPDHIVDARTGAPSHCLRAVTAVALDGVHADAWATAYFAACGEVELPRNVRVRARR